MLSQAEAEELVAQAAFDEARQAVAILSKMTCLVMETDDDSAS